MTVLWVFPLILQNLDDGVLDSIDDVLDNTDLLVIVGTSSVVYPAAGYAPQVAQRWDTSWRGGGLELSKPSTTAQLSSIPPCPVGVQQGAWPIACLVPDVELEQLDY